MNTQTATNNIVTPRPKWSIADQMHAFAMDEFRLGEGITIEDWRRGGFTDKQIANHGPTVAKRLGRRMVRQLEVA